LSESDYEAEIYHASDEDEYCPEPAAIENEESDADIEHVINHDEEFDSDESNEDESIDIMSRCSQHLNIRVKFFYPTLVRAVIAFLFDVFVTYDYRK